MNDKYDDIYICIYRKQRQQQQKNNDKDEETRLCGCKESLQEKEREGKKKKT